MEHSSILQPSRLGIVIQPISDSRLRVGVLSYLNTQPLIFGLRALAPHLRVRLAAPAKLARDLRAGRLDVALVPVLEYFSNPDYGLIRESAICADGHVRSVILFSRAPIGEVQSIRFDPESLTSNALLRVLCRYHFMIWPRWARGLAKLDPAEALDRQLADAALVIGNRALAMSGRYPYEYDLGREWWRLTRLPFVFAVWAVRPGVETGDLKRVLCASLKLGKSHLELIAREAAATYHLDQALVFSYLKKMIRYDLTARAWEGMARFFDLCGRMGLCPTAPPRDLARKMSGEEEEEA